MKDDKTSIKEEILEMEQKAENYKTAFYECMGIVKFLKHKLKKLEDGKEDK
tara:strand:+ start:81 stop:233 length:153 start_codon:yes stop_codon:yes gene_type:complete